MCYTNSLYTDLKKLAKNYDLPADEGPDFEPIAKASGFDFPAWPILTSSEPGRFVEASWGLIPAWVKTRQQALSIRSNTLNARSETRTEKPSFKHAALSGQRCVVPSTGFFEWQTIGKKKYPYFISLVGTEVISMAGLWEEYTTPEGERLTNFTILTVPANPLMEKIHNSKKRMPAILTREKVSLWLDISLSDDSVTPLLAPLDEKLMTAHTIRPLGTMDTSFEAVTQPYEYPELTRQLGLF